MLWLLLICYTSVAAFTTVWVTSMPNETITLPYAGQETRVDWGDETSEYINAENPSHVYAIAGSYTIAIEGTVSDWMFEGVELRIVQIESWDGFLVTGNIGVFQGCSNLTTIAAGQPKFNPNSSLAYFFSGCSKLDSPLHWDITGVTSLEGFLSHAISFNSQLNFTGTSEVTTMSKMFQNSSFNQPLDHFNTSNVVTMSYMFHLSAFNQPLNWNTNLVEDMQQMFDNSPLNSLLTFSSTASVTNMIGMFQYSSFNQPLNWDLRNVITMKSMFEGTPFNSSLTFNHTDQVTDTTAMFRNTPFNQNLNNFDTSNVILMEAMFADSQFNQPLEWDTSKVQNMNNMFFNTPFNSELRFGSTTNVVYMTSMFESCKNFNQNLDHFDTSNVKNMNRMFAQSSFNQPLNWNTGKVTNMHGMFESSLYNSTLNFSSTANVTNMGKMFYNSMFNQNLDHFDTSLVTQMEGMFAFSSFNQPLHWNTDSVLNMNFMFAGTPFNSVLNFSSTSRAIGMTGMFMASSFNQNLNFDDTSAVKNMENMFAYSAFNKPLNWTKTYTVTTMSGMFENSRFNQPLFFNTSSVVNMSRMFFNTSFNSSLNFDTTKVEEMNHMFFGNSTFPQNLEIWSVSQVTKCSSFCDACILPNFTSCQPCAFGVFIKKNGKKVCKDAPIGCELKGSSCAVYSPINSTIINASNGTTVIVNPDLAFNGTGTISVQVFPPDNRTRSNIVRILFLGPDGPQHIAKLRAPIVIRIPLIPVIWDTVRVCLGDELATKVVQPECKYLDEATDLWVSDGCQRTNLSLTEIECTCSHLTDFAAVLPVFNVIPPAAVLDVTPKNIRRHPTGIIVIMTVLSVFGIVFSLAAYRDRKEANAVDLKASKQAKWHKYYAARKTGKRRTLWKELKVHFQLRHTWSSLINRKSGTSFQSVDRTFVALTTVFASMSMGALFHGLDQTWFGRGEVIIFSMLMCLLPAQVLTQLFVRTGPMGFYEEWEVAVGIRRPSKYRCLNYRFPGWWRWVWVSASLLSTLGMIVYILTISLTFDSNPTYYCYGNNATLWVTDWLLSYGLVVFVTEPLRVCVLVCASRLQGELGLATLNTLGSSETSLGSSKQLDEDSTSTDD